MKVFWFDVFLQKILKNIQHLTTNTSIYLIYNVPIFGSNVPVYYMAKHSITIVLKNDLSLYGSGVKPANFEIIKVGHLNQYLSQKDQIKKNMIPEGKRAALI